MIWTDRQPCAISRSSFPTKQTFILNSRIVEGYINIKNKDENIHKSLAKNSLKSQQQQKSEPPGTDTGYFHSSNHLKLIPYQILGGKTKNNVKIDSQTKEIWSTKLTVMLLGSECLTSLSSYREAELLIEKLLKIKEKQWLGKLI